MIQKAWENIMNVVITWRSPLQIAICLLLIMRGASACQPEPAKPAPRTNNPKPVSTAGGPQTGQATGTGTGNTTPPPPATPTAGGNPEAIAYVGPENFGLHLSYPTHSPQNNFTYYCPGDSFLLGFKSAYETTANDRINRFHCQFLQDGRGLPIRKSSCTLHNLHANFGEDYNFTCPEKKAMAGVNSRYDGATGDRTSSFLCCEMQNVEEKKVVIDEQKCSTEVPYRIREYRDQSRTPFANYINDEVNTLRGDLDFTCKNAAILGENPQTRDFAITPVPNAVLNRVQTRFVGPSQDRYFSFGCCALKIE